MGIKCSLFGHAYGETTVERDRSEQGSEVVITIREIETCERCGQTRVVSENKEVTTIETPDDVSLEGRESGEDAPAEGGQTGPAIVDAEEGEPVRTDEPSLQEKSEDVREEPPSAAEDDGVILEDETASESDRDPGEWPETEDVAEPEEPTSGPESAEAGTETPADQPDSSEVWSEPDPDLEGDRPGSERTTVPEGHFRCPRCDFRTPVESSSLREGDYCPECHQGTLITEAE